MAIDIGLSRLSVKKGRNIELTLNSFFSALNSFFSGLTLNSFFYVLLEISLKKRNIAGVNRFRNSAVHYCLTSSRLLASRKPKIKACQIFREKEISGIREIRLSGDCKRKVPRRNIEYSEKPEMIGLGV